MSATMAKLVNTTNFLFNILDLRPYAMILPMDESSGIKNKVKILSRIFNNHKIRPRNIYSEQCVQDNPPADECVEDKQMSSDDTNASLDQMLEEADNPDCKFHQVKSIIDRIDKNIKGCLILLAKRHKFKDGIVPFAGGVIEVVDENERCIQALWASKGIDENIEVLLEAFCIRLCAHAYQMSLPHSKRGKHSSRLVSVYHSVAQTFPVFAYDFIKNSMRMSMHVDRTNFSGQHNDNPNIQCKCTRDFSDKELHLTFYGISESRFISMYQNTYERILNAHISGTGDPAILPYLLDISPERTITTEKSKRRATYKSR